MRYRALTTTLCAAVLAACKVGPNFVPPNEPVPDHYAGAGTAAGAGDAGTRDAAGAGDAPAVRSDAQPDSFWWRQFKDPELDRLVDEVKAGNLDLKASYLRIVEARLEVLSASAQGLPSLNASASYTREQLGLAGILKSQGFSSSSESTTTQQFLSSVESPINLYQLGFDASWELDLFGKVRRSVEVAGAQGAGTVESRNDLLVSLEAEVAQDYLQLRAAQVLRKTTLDEIAAQREVVDLTRDRRDHGLSGEPELDSAQAELASLESQLPPYEQTIATARHALAVLAGEDPAKFDDRFGTAGELPELPASIPVGVPSTLARRRPDIRNAETALHAATAEIGVSVASLFPDVSLSGTYGLRNLSTSYLFDWQSRFYTFGPKISIPIFRGGQLLTSVKLSRAQAVEAALNYRKAVLTALQEVDDALSALREDAARSASLREAVAADDRALAVDTDAFSHGLATYITVLTQQLQAVEARQQLEEALLTQRTDLVKLYKALGGGWESAPAATGTAIPAAAAN